MGPAAGSGAGPHGTGGGENRYGRALANVHGAGARSCGKGKGNLRSGGDGGQRRIAPATGRRAIQSHELSPTREVPPGTDHFDPGRCAPKTGGGPSPFADGAGLSPTPPPHI